MICEKLWITNCPLSSGPVMTATSGDDWRSPACSLCSKWKYTVLFHSANRELKLKAKLCTQCFFFFFMLCFHKVSLGDFCSTISQSAIFFSLFLIYKSHHVLQISTFHVTHLCATKVYEPSGAFLSYLCRFNFIFLWGEYKEHFPKLNTHLFFFQDLMTCANILSISLVKQFKYLIQHFVK